MKASKSATNAWGGRFAPVMTMMLAVCLLSLPAACAKWPPAPPLEQAAPQDIGLLPPSVSAASSTGGPWKVTFRFTPPDGADSVNVAGSFNGWNPRGEPMTRVAGTDEWSCTTILGPGKYQYKFVINGARWLPDPLNPERVDDNRNGFNSVLVLGRLAAMNKSNGRIGDEKINPIGLLHVTELPLYYQPINQNEILLRYRTLAHDVARVWVALKDGARIEMHPVLEGPLFTTWEADVTLPAVEAGAGQPRGITYTFVLADRNQRVCDPQIYSVTVTTDEVFLTPGWAKNAVWYQIMPERFRNGTTANDPDPARPWTSEWFTPSPWEAREDWTFYKYYVFFRRYGGDLQGVTEELPYLEELGVNALYFNPIFQAPTHHKYDADSYTHVDENLGVVGDYNAVAATEDLNDPTTWKWTASDKVFLQFIKEAHAAGFHVIIDGVFNHVGRNHPAFQDVLKNGRDSKYADWFDVISWEPFKYRGWAGHDSLPVFKKSADGLACEAVKQHIFNVTRRWMDPDGDGDPGDGIDGWRLDVPNEIPMPFWTHWRKLVKSINPEAYITGEIWDQADAWLDGNHFDAVMNYQFAHAAIAWICNRQQKISPSQINNRLARLRLAYPAAATYVLQNLVDSHDTDRLVSMALNPDRVYDQLNRVQDSNPNYNNNKPGPEQYRRARLVALLQMTYVGAPMVYYGDEVGMWGADDPTCRKPMLWEDLQPYDAPEENFVMKDQLDFYRKSIALRNDHPALRTGSFQSLLTDDARDVWVFLRSDNSEQLIVALNASKVPVVEELPEPSVGKQAWRVVFGEDGALERTGGALKLKIPALGGVVLQAASER